MAQAPSLWLFISHVTADGSKLLQPALEPRQIISERLLPLSTLGNCPGPGIQFILYPRQSDL